MAQIHLFPAPAKPAPVRLEVHEHCIIRGRRANGWNSSFEHSHEGGDVPHSHPDTGPASYTIDKDEWLRATGLKGGGRKKFTAKPTGEQFELIPRTAEESTFEIVVCDPPAPPGFVGEGGGMAAAARMTLGHRLTPLVRPANPNGGRSHG